MESSQPRGGPSSNGATTSGVGGEEPTKGIKHHAPESKKPESDGHEKAPETAVPRDEYPFKATDVSSADAAKILNNLDNLARGL